MKKEFEKTNVMRLLEQKGIPYICRTYLDTGAIAGLEVAAVLGEDPTTVFKTLVTVGRSGAHYVFVLPVTHELDLKKAARSVAEKNVEMLKAKDLLPLTGYVHGGCSPIGMKKQFPTVLDVRAKALDTLFISGGCIGYQIGLAPAALLQAIPYRLMDICYKGTEKI